MSRGEMAGLEVVVEVVAEEEEGVEEEEMGVVEVDMQVVEGAEVVEDLDTRERRRACKPQPSANPRCLFSTRTHAAGQSKRTTSAHGKQSPDYHDRQRTIELDV